MDESPLQFIPDELLKHIIEFLPPEYLFILSQVCRKLYEISHDFTYFKNQIIQSLETRNIHLDEDYLAFIPLCINGMKQFKYVNKWKHIPIEYFHTLYHSQILGFENIMTNYISRCNNIVSLSITVDLNYDVIKFMEDNLPSSIKKITLTDYYGNRDPIIMEFNSCKIPNVKIIQLYYTMLTNKSNFSNLITLTLYYIFIELTEEHKVQLSNIKNLTIYYCLAMEDLKFLKNNEVLSLNHISLSQELLDSLSKNKKLKKLTLNTYLDTARFNLSVFGTSNLEYLTINNFGKYILNLNGFENIKFVNLSDVRVSNIHNTMFNKVLNLSNCNIKQHMIPKLLNVEKLNISNNCKIRDTSIFSSEECNIKVLDLSYNEHIKYIDNLSNLEELSVIGCNNFIGIFNVLSRLKDTRLYINSCYCKKCIPLYKHNIQKKIIRNNTYTSKCLYEYKYDWFKF